MSCHLIYTFLKRVYVKLFSKPFSELNSTFRTRVIEVQFKMTTSVMLLLPRGLLMCMYRYCRLVACMARHYIKCV